MYKPILYFAAAGAAGVGGAAGAVFLARRGQQEAAIWLQERDRAAAALALRGEIDLQSLREEARAAGVDPDVVEQGYYNLRDGVVSLNQVETQLHRLLTDTP
ncbi:hypothetical protein [Micromonospora aurantiaca (nom. illeg.)]|uniref:hypothetical protein n=1 Tax=Micromonospora aurantiaca (nom. illeg.) TaxID=47850 RepID=UPI0033F1254B